MLESMAVKIVLGLAVLGILVAVAHRLGATSAMKKVKDDVIKKLKEVDARKSAPPMSDAEHIKRLRRRARRRRS